MNNIFRFFVRISAFLLKEIFEIIRQPMLVLTLILGPFLILLFFGIGFRNEPRSLRTAFVVEDNERLANQIERFASSLGKQLIFYDVMNSLEEAQEKLQQGEIDLITVVPSHAYETIKSNEQVVLELYHREIDPFQTDYINVFGRVYVNEVNRRILREITTEGQTDIAQAQEKLSLAQSNAVALRETLEECAKFLGQPEDPSGCNQEALENYLRALDRNIDEIDRAMGDEMRMSEAIRKTLNEETSAEIEDPLPKLEDIVEDANELGEGENIFDDYVEKIETLTELEQDLEEIRTRLENFSEIDPRILISPFRSESVSMAKVIPTVGDYFAPSVIVLLLQHLAITFAALSIVRERILGTMELFYVSPLSAFEALIGKYLSYLLFGSFLATILFALVIYGLGTPLLGEWREVAWVMVALLFSSMGIGFVISLISKTDIQAVQYSMLVLLTSVFFSGFFLSLETLWQPVRLISWLLPATYAILMLRDIMLRGHPLDVTLLNYLLGIGAILFIAAWILFRRSMVMNR